jgi:2-oxoglutarate dehydrogenase E1 component
MTSKPPIPHVLNVEYVESLHGRYVQDRGSVPSEWRAYFEEENGDRWPAAVRRDERGRRRSIFNPQGAEPSRPVEEGAESGVWQERINQLIRAYRVRGHLVAHVHPIGATPPAPAELDPTFYGFSHGDMDRRFPCEILQPDGGALTLRQILEVLRNTYCRFIGVQYMHIGDPDLRHWLQERMEGTQNRIQLLHEVQERILSRLTDATVFEEFLRKKFLGAKTFSLEGCESLIPLLDLAIEKAGDQGVKEIVMGMAHRGRLNVLANILGKSARQIFREFADTDAELYTGRGDVKYHLGHSHDWLTASGRKVHLSLCFNPSHLEFVNPVVLGRVRAKQDRAGDTDRSECMGLLIHGDAAFAGEGVAQETLNLSRLQGYTTGGTLHIIVNNQIGFTTSPSEGRSCRYCTDVARMLQVPIFHVNGEDPEAVAQCLHLAMDFRKQFKRDVLIDMYGYRKFGHNETDEPSFTQPTLYRAIADRPSVHESYLGHLLTLGGITREEAEAIAVRRRKHLEDELSEARSEDYEPPGEKRLGIWSRSHFHGGDESTAQEVSTAVDKSRLGELLLKLTELPEDFTPHPKLERMREVWRKMAEGKEPLDWAAAETLAYATLASEGVRIRLSGQDARRGTFSHRHAVLHDYEGQGSTYIPLRHLDASQAPVDVFNSPLSETGVLGFDYGFSLDSPDALVLWEAQFGDFANAAQVIIDQFIASAEDKWQRLSGIVLLLPHGFEGMGPEHSSARLERFLSLCAEHNIQVTYPTTPAQFFHLLRRQVRRLWRKPLVVLTPKSLLRHPEVRSPLDELARGTFQRVIPDSHSTRRPAKVLLCGGKIYYELLQRREQEKRKDVLIHRLEQFYPLPPEWLEKLLKPVPAGTPVVWVQEEPANMGAWPFLRLQLGEQLLGKWPFSLVSRPESASPASGSATAHKQEQEHLIGLAFAMPGRTKPDRTDRKRATRKERKHGR